MPHLEPTYLRYIYDGLIKGSIHPENAAELPDGLIGMYEEAFDERTSVIERQKLLQRFAIWALLKKEVSAAFVAEVLGESEDDIQEFISTYSAWFNSPESGKYQLYHERLKVYLLQKLSEGEVHMLHEKSIGRLKQAIEAQKADEFEWYGLEFLTSHLAVAAMLNGDGQKLIDLAYSQTYWQRQLKISKGYSWTNNGLKQVMTWASKYNDDEVIECGLQMVDLYHQEQNAAPQIVALVSEGDFDAALKRIEQFGGSDKNGLQRKFILYMLCLMELTLLESKNKPYRKEGIDKLLKHLDEQLPVDHSVLNWGEFFSSYLMFRMAFEWNEIDSDCLKIFELTSKWELSWIENECIYSSKQIMLLLTLIRLEENNSRKVTLFLSVVRFLLKQGERESTLSIINEALTISNTISCVKTKCTFLIQLYSFFHDLGDEVKSNFIKNEIYTSAQEIDDLNQRGQVIFELSAEFARQGMLEIAFLTASEMDLSVWKIRANLNLSSIVYMLGDSDKAFSIIQNMTSIIENITEDSTKNQSLLEISKEYVRQGKYTDAISAVDLMSDEYLKEYAFSNLSALLLSQGQITEALFCINSIGEEYDKCETIKNITKQLRNVNKKDILEFLIIELLVIARSFNSNLYKIDSLSSISTLLSYCGAIEDASFVINEALSYAVEIKNEHKIGTALVSISCSLAEQGLYLDANAIISKIYDKPQEKRAIHETSKIFIQNRNFSEVLNALLTSLNLKPEFTREIFKHRVSKALAINFIEKGKFENASICAQKIPLNNDDDIEIIVRICIGFVKNGQIDRAISIAHNTNDNKIWVIGRISTSLMAIGSRQNALHFMENAIMLAREVDDIWFKTLALVFISNEQLKHGNIKDSTEIIQEALSCVYSFDDIQWKDICLKIIALNFISLGKMQDAISIANDIEGIEEKNEILAEMINLLAKDGKVELAASYIKNISGESEKILPMLSVYFALSKEEKFEESSVFLDEISKIKGNIGNSNKRNRIQKQISCEFAKSAKFPQAISAANDISNELERCKAYSTITTEMIKKGQLEQALLNARTSIHNSIKNSIISLVAVEYAIQGKWQKSETLVSEITKIEARQECWINIAQNIYLAKGLNYSLITFGQLQNAQVKAYFMKGIVDTISSTQSNREIILPLVFNSQNHMESLENSLLNYYLNQLFFSVLEPKIINRLNRTFDIQWAIDIKNQLPN